MSKLYSYTWVRANNLSFLILTDTNKPKLGQNYFFAVINYGDLEPSHTTFNTGSEQDIEKNIADYMTNLVEEKPGQRQVKEQQIKQGVEQFFTGQQEAFFFVDGLHSDVVQFQEHQQKYQAWQAQWQD